jgi:hypothetical protein
LNDSSKIYTTKRRDINVFIKRINILFDIIFTARKMQKIKQSVQTWQRRKNMQLSCGEYVNYQLLWLKQTLRLSRVSTTRSDITITLAGTT